MFACIIGFDGIEYICVLHICPFADMVYLNILNGQLGTHVGDATFLDRRRPIGAPRWCPDVFGPKEVSWGPALPTQVSTTR